MNFIVSRFEEITTFCLWVDERNLVPAVALVNILRLHGLFGIIIPFADLDLLHEVEAAQLAVFTLHFRFHFGSDGLKPSLLALEMFLMFIVMPSGRLSFGFTMKASG